MPNDEQVPINSPKDEDTRISMKQIKLRYGVIVLVVFLLALVFKWAAQSNDFWKVFGAMNGKCHGDTYCLASTFTLRLSFSLFVFFFGHALISTGFSRHCLGDANFKSFLTNGLLIKIVLLAILIVVTLFIPFDFFVGYAYFAFAASVLFLLVQTVILLDFAYSWNEKWIPEDGVYDSEDDASRFKKFAVCVTMLFFSTGIVVCALCYKWFAPSGCPSDDKNLQLFFITFTLLFGILATLGSAVVERGSILISTLAFAYCAVMTYSAIRSRGNEACDELYSDPTKVNFNTILSLVIAAAAIIHASLSAGESRGALSTSTNDEDNEYFSFSFFFSSFAMGSCYLAMTLNSWDINTGDSSGSHADVLASETSEASMWIKISTVWFTMVLFIWALLAPVVCGEDGFCCRDRTF